MAFKLVKYVPWVQTELDDKEPAYLPTMFPVCLMGKEYTQGIGFGYKTLYGHLSKYKVKRGQRIERGDLIALTGSSGKLSTGPHLHYEVRHNGIALNPRNFIFDDVNIFDLAKK